MGFDDDLKKLFEDLTDIPKDLIAAPASMYDGPGGIIGIMVSGAMIYVQGPAGIIPAIAYGLGVKEGLNALIKTRGLSKEERTVAELVFGKNLVYENIILTNLTPPVGRAFVVTNTANQCLVNFGSYFDNPIHSPHNADSKCGELFIHELTHVWQSQNTNSKLKFICEAVGTQARKRLLGEKVSDPGNGRGKWEDYNPEQQATIVATWYSEGCEEQNEYYHYVEKNINKGFRPLALQPLSVCDIAKRKFDVDKPFNFAEIFPQHDRTTTYCSVRKSLIGLH